MINRIEFLLACLTEIFFLSLFSGCNFGGIINYPTLMLSIVFITELNNIKVYCSFTVFAFVGHIVLTIADLTELADIIIIH